MIMLACTGAAQRRHALARPMANAFRARPRSRLVPTVADREYMTADGHLVLAYRHPAPEAA